MRLVREVVYRAHHLGPVADRSVEGHVAGAQSLALLGLRRDPDGLLGVLGYVLEGTGVRFLAVAAPVAEDYDRRAMVYGRRRSFLNRSAASPKSLFTSTSISGR